MSAPALSGVIVTEPIIRARLRKAHDKQYRGGVLGLRARPVWDGRDFDYDGSPVTVVACPSVLAIWEAIEARVSAAAAADLCRTWVAGQRTAGSLP